MNRLFSWVVYIVSMAVVARWYGGAFFKSPKVIKNVAYCLLMCLPILVAYIQAEYTLVTAVLVYLSASALTIPGKSTGHGQWFDLATWRLPVKPEKLDFIVKWFFGADTFDDYHRDLFGLLVKGTAILLPSAVAIAFLSPFAGVIYLLTAFAFPASYAIARSVGWGTEGGEYLSGGLIATFMVLGLLII